MKLKELSLKDCNLFEKFLSQGSNQISKSSFASLFLDKALFKVKWQIYADCLCIFAIQKSSSYMLLPPLGKLSREVVAQCFEIMDGLNSNPQVSRIENVGLAAKKDLEILGLVSKESFAEYVYRCKDLVNLEGNSFKAKRAGMNYFKKNYAYSFEEFALKHTASCLKLYREWAKERKAKNSDYIYQSMLDENFNLHKMAMLNYKKLKIQGIVVKVRNKLSAYSLGFQLNAETFCNILEVADNSKKGLAQFIFQKFCESRKEEFINTMDDSGIELLRKTKISYRPLKKEPIFSSYRSLNGPAA